MGADNRLPQISMFVKIAEYGVLVPGERGVDGAWTKDSVSLEEAFKAHGVWMKQDIGGKSKKMADDDENEDEKPKIPGKIGVRTMNLQGCGLTDLTLRKVAHIMRVNTTLETLHAAWNRVSDEGATYLGQSIRVNHTLVSLDLSHNEVCNAGCASLCDGIRVNSTLTRLRLDSNVDIDADGVKSIAEMLLEHQHITELGLSGIGIKNTGATHLAAALLPNKAITELSLANTSIGPDGATALAKSLSTRDGNKTLLTLDMSSNMIGDTGTRALAAALRPAEGHRQEEQPMYGSPRTFVPSGIPEGLTNLDLRNNDLGPKAITDLAATLKTNRVLTSIDACGNRCEDGGAIAIGRAITYNRTLKSLHFYDKSIGMKTCKWVAEVLADSCVESFDFAFQIGLPDEKLEHDQRPKSPSESSLVQGSALAQMASQKEEEVTFPSSDLFCLVTTLDAHAH